MSNQDINKINKIKLPNGQVYKIDATYWGGKTLSDIKPSDFGLSSVLKYCGITTTPLEDGSDVNPVIINEKEHLASTGCVVFYKDKEFVFNANSKWELFGAENTYKVVQNPVSSPNVSGDATAFIDTISQDANGVITATKKNVDMPIVKGDAENSAVLKGGNNQATNANEAAFGKYNNSESNTQFSIGIGTSDTDRKNAFEVKQNGDIYIEGVEGKIQDKLNEISQINKTIEDNEEVIATALCELNEKVGEIEKTQEKAFIMPEDFIEEQYNEPDENGYIGKVKQEYVIDILENGYTKILSIEDGIPYVYELDYFDLYSNNVLKVKLRIEHVQENNTGETINIIEINTNRDSVDFCKCKMQLFIYNFPFTYSGTSTPENSDGYKRLNFINSVLTDGIDLPEENKQLFKKNMGSFADWNAQEGEAGYIENRTHYNSENTILQKIDDKDLGNINIKGYDRIHIIYDYKNGETDYIIIDVKNKYIIDSTLENWKNGYADYQFDDDDSFSLYVDDYDYDYGVLPNINVIGYITKQLDSKYLPDTVLKTTPQTLSDDAKNQALVNLGIPFVSGDGENSAVLKGGNNVASYSNSSAFGFETKASGDASHAEGLNTRTYNEAEHASGKYNKSTAKTEDNTTAEATQFSIGIGTSETDRKNAVEVKQNGDVYITGIGGFTGANSDSSQSVQDVINELVNIINEITIK